MPKPNEKLAESLRQFNAAQRDHIIRHDRLTRDHRSRLENAGFLQNIMRGWSAAENPTVRSSETTWFSHYWSFVAQYLEHRFGTSYCLSPEASLKIHAGSKTIPKQLVVHASTGSDKPLALKGEVSLFTYSDPNFASIDKQEVEGLCVMTLPQALVRVSEGFLRNSPQDAAIALRMIREPSTILKPLLDNERTVVAGRLAGAFRHIGKGDFADQIIKTMHAADLKSRETNPFDRSIPALELIRGETPQELRIRTMWKSMRDDIIAVFPNAPGLPSDKANYLKSIDDIYAHDAYNSLSIEGYRVSPELIEKVRTQGWNPEGDPTDKEHHNALAAKGYFDSFSLVKQTVTQLLSGESPGMVRKVHHDWHRALFQSMVPVGLLKPADLAGYRNDAVFIKGSRHIPMRHEIVPDAMSVLFDLISSEPLAAVRAVLGHFIFVNIHPYPDGNGRLGRFFMNAMMATGGYPWTVVRLENRDEYMASLEEASVKSEIGSFARFIRQEMEDSLLYLNSATSTNRRTSQ